MHWDRGIRQEMDEQELGDRFRAGDERAVEQVIVLFQPKMAKIVHRLLAWPEDVSDVVQNVFVAAIVARASFRNQSRLLTWLTRIAINECRKHHRQQKIRSRLPNGLVSLPMRTAPPPPNQIAERKEQCTAVRSAICQLTPKYREVIVMRYLEHMTVHEIAELLRVRDNTVEVRLTRGRAKLAKLLKTCSVTKGRTGIDGRTTIA